jgi:hypothetical protein
MKVISRKIPILWFLFAIVTTNTCAVQPDARPNTQALVEQANELINQAHFQKAYEILKPLADAGDPNANHKIAMLYRNENEKNPYYDVEKSLKAYYFAANAGHAWAMIGLAQVLRHIVVEKAANYQYNYKNPELKQFAEKYYKESCMWFEKAARRGEGHAMLDTARCYQDGYVTGEKDYVMAYAWFALAEGSFDVEAGDRYAPNSMAQTFMKRTAKRGNLTQRQIQQALDLAKQLHKEITGS